MFEYHESIMCNHCIELYGVHSSHFHLAILPVVDSLVASKFYHCNKHHSMSPNNLYDNIFEPHT